MPVSQGEVDMFEIRSVMGGTDAAGLQQYYGIVNGIPSSGSIGMFDFRGKEPFVQTTVTVTEGGFVQSKIIDYMQSGWNQYKIGDDYAGVQSGGHGSRSPTTFKGQAIYTLMYTVGGYTEGAPADWGWQFNMNIAGIHPRTYINRILPQSAPAWLNQVDASWANFSGEPGRLAMTQWQWGNQYTSPTAIGANSRWENRSGNSTVIIEYPP